MDQKDLFRVADRGTAGLGVLDDAQRLFLIGGGVDEDVTDAGTGLDTGHFGLFGAAADQPAAEARIAAHRQPLREALGLRQRERRGKGGSVRECGRVASPVFVELSPLVP